MRGRLSDLSHETLLRGLVLAKSEDERTMLLVEVRRRLEGTPEPRSSATPWHPGNGGC